MNSPTVTLTETWIHHHACPRILTGKCGCGSMATLCRVTKIQWLEPEIELFCDKCTPVVHFPMRHTNHKQIAAAQRRLKEFAIK